MPVGKPLSADVPFGEGSAGGRGRGEGVKKSEQRSNVVEGWEYGDDVLLEHYRYAPGSASEVPKQSHEEYQFCLSLDFPGEYRYRGERHVVPVGSLSVIHPGEVHSSRDPHDREAPATYRVMYVDPAMIARVAAELTAREGISPFFPNPVIFDRGLSRAFLTLHESLDGPATRLEWDSRLLSVLSGLVSRYSEGCPSPMRPAGGERRAVRLVKEYLESSFVENVSLEELSALANLSPFHLARVFSAEVGLPPHAYQTQLRVARARDLILRGWPISKAAQETGFADQSHLTRHFKRLVGVPPGSYARNSKNVQYEGGRAIYPHEQQR